MNMLMNMVNFDHAEGAFLKSISIYILLYGLVVIFNLYDF